MTFDCVQRFPGDGIFGRALVNPDRNNFAPRAGVAYRISDRVVAKGGYAIFYQAIDRMGSSAALPLNPPQLIDFRGYESRFNEVPQLLLRDPFPGGTSEFNPQTIDLRSRSFDEEAPLSQQYSFGFEFRLRDNYLMDVSYVGGDSNKIRKLQALNQGILGADGSITQPFPLWARLSDHLRSNGNSNYNALQFSLRRAMSHGLAFNVGYTWSKALGRYPRQSLGWSRCQQRPASKRPRSGGRLRPSGFRPGPSLRVELDLGDPLQQRRARKVPVGRVAI